MKNSKTASPKVRMQNGVPKRSFFRNLVRYRVLLLMCLPAILFFFFISYVPLPGIWIAFVDYNVRDGIFGSEFVGWRNFEFLASSGKLWSLTKNTILYNLAFILLGNFLAVFMAILLNELFSTKAKKIYQNILFLPTFFSALLVAKFFNMMLSNDIGLINDVLKRIGLDPVMWYNNSAYWIPIVMFAMCWKGLGYGIVHYESPDRRGIDCGLVYRKPVLDLSRSSPKHVFDSSGAVMATRDILLAEFDSLAVLVNHHPSKIGGKSDRRDAAMRRMHEIVDSLRSTGVRRILAVGDFNDELWASEGMETLKYNGNWEKIDGFFSFGDFDVQESVFSDRMLMMPDKAFGGMKPRRCFVGPRYEGGVSDPLPIILKISF